MKNKWRVNTSNPNKLEEFRRYLGEVESIKIDLKEPDADLITVIRYKASQFDGVLVDDTSLFIENETVGANIRWFLNELPKFVGKRATFVCLLAIHKNNQVEIYRGQVDGTIVEPRGNSFGFNNYFLPTGSDQTFGESIPDLLNPRYLAIREILIDNPSVVENPLKEWAGPFQKEH